MPKRTNYFQRLITLIESQLAPTGAKITESKMLVDLRTGTLREVDLTIEFTSGVHPFVIGIECTNKGRPADATWVEGIYAKHQDLRINKTVAVSRSGFTKEAVAKADKLKIDALTLEQAVELDWLKVLPSLKVITLSSFLQPYATGVKVIFADSGFRADSNQFNNLADLTLYGPTGEARGKLSKIVDDYLAHPEMNAHLEKHAFTDSGTAVEMTISVAGGSYILATDGSKHLVVSLEVQAKCKKEVSTVSLEHGAYVSAGVAHGGGTSFGHPVQVAAVEQKDQAASVGVSIQQRRSGSHKKSKARTKFN